jgi:uncharacterized protein HemX
MTEPVYTETTTTRSNVPPSAQQPTTTIVERRGGGGGMLIGLAALILVIVGAWYLFNQSQQDAVRTDAVTSAAKSVGDTADKAGAAIDKAVE